MTTTQKPILGPTNKNPLSMATTQKPKVIQITVNDRIGKKEKIKCNEDDTIRNLKVLIAFKFGTHPDKMKLYLGNRVFPDKVTLADLEIHQGTEVNVAYD